MDSDAVAEQALNPESAKTCSDCDEWQRKCLKLKESRNALRQAVKVLEQKINQTEAHNVNLEKAYQEEQARTKMEKEEKLKESNARVSLENEISGLKSEIAALQQKVGADAEDGNGDVKVLQASISDKENEINKLKEVLEQERKRVDSESKNVEREKLKAAEICKLLEAEKNKSAEKGMQIARIEAEKAEEYRLQQARLSKEINEAKTKLASEMSKFKEATKRFESEKQKLLVDKRDAVSEMAKIQEKVEVEKQKAAQEKKRADAEMIKAEQHKKLAEDNQKKAMEAKLRVDEMSQKLAENKRMIEDLKQKIHELSSLRKPNELSGVSSDNAESAKVQHLEDSLKLEVLRAKVARKKYKLEASHHSNLQHALGDLKLDLIQFFRRLDMLDGSVSPIDGSIPGLIESQNMPNMQKSNVIGEVCNLNTSQMHSQVENDLMKPFSTRTNACNPVRKNMQNTTLLPLSGVNYAESITGVNTELGSNKAKLQSSAVNSCTASFSDRQLMGSQERGALQVAASTKLAQENFNVIASMPNPSDRSDIEHDRKRKRILDSVECIANLSYDGKKSNMQVEDNLSDLCGLVYRKRDKSVEAGRELVSYHIDNIQSESDRADKKRKKCHGAEVCTNEDEKNGTEETSAGVCEDENGCSHASYPASYALRTDQACRERIFDAPDNVNSVICFDEVNNSNFMQLLGTENAAGQESFRRAVDALLSPSQEIETFEMDNLRPSLDEALHEDDLLSQRDLFPYPTCEVIDVEIKSNKQKFDVFTGPSDTHFMPTQASKTHAKWPTMQTSENLMATFLVEPGIGSLHSQLPYVCFVLTDIEDSSTISRTFGATKNCIARCSLDTQTEWTVDSILIAVEEEKMRLQMEKHSVLLTLLLFNFTKTTAMKFGGLWSENLVFCLNSYAEHFRKVIMDADRRTLFLENFSLQELLCLIGDFLVEGKVVYKNIVPTETSSMSDLRTNNFLEGAETFSLEVASSEQLVAASIVLASLCAAIDHVGFISEASYNILRSSRWDSLMVLTILHIFANLGGRKFFDMDNFGLTEMVLKSLVLFLEGGSISVTNASCVPSVNQLHTELCTGGTCPFSEGAQSIDAVTLLLLEKIKNCQLEQAEQFDSSNFRCLSDSCNAQKWSNQEVVQCVSGLNCDVPCCLEKHMICPAQPDVVINFTMCQLSDILSLLELLANKMSLAMQSWQWTNVKLVPQLLSMLDSCAVENFAVAIIVFLGQLGRLGVDVGGYEDQGVENLMGNLCSYLCRYSSMKAGPPQLQIATATALFGLLPLDFKNLLHVEFSLPASSSKSVSYAAENLRNWFFGLGKDQQDLLYDILGRTDVDKQQFY